jgi:RES domain-containing protein
LNIWRISRYISLDGEGGRRYPGRWNTAGRPLVYLADSSGSALNELLAHLELTEDQIPSGYILLKVSVPETVSILDLMPSAADWKHNLPLTRSLGDTWLREKSSALARVRSALLPLTFNYLLNPLHPDAARITITDSHPIDLDHRLLRTATP